MIGQLDLGLIVDEEHSVHSVFVYGNWVEKASFNESTSLLVTLHSDFTVGISRLSVCLRTHGFDFELVRAVTVPSAFDLCRGPLLDDQVVLFRDRSVEWATHSESRTELLIVDAATGKQRCVSISVKEPKQILKLEKSCLLEVEKEEEFRVFKVDFETF